MSNGQLEDSLRREIESYLEGRLSGINREIAELQSQLNESLTRLLDRQSEAQLDGSVTASIAEHLRAAHETGIELAVSESIKAKASSDMAIVKAAIQEIDEQRSQAEILKALINRGASFAPRVAFFVVKGEQANGWRGRGFEGTVGDEAIPQLNLSLLADTMLSEAARSRTTWSGTPNSHSEDHLLLNRLGEHVPERVVAVPLTVRGKTVAVLYADSDGLASDAINLEALETLTRVAGMAVELLSLSSVPAAKRAEGPAEDRVAETAPAYTPTREYEEARPAEPPPDVTIDQPSEAAEESAPALTPVQRPLQVAPAPLAAEPFAAVGVRRRYGIADTDLPIEVGSEEERRLHNDARRFARLLISEIKLYNEQKVLEGRSQNDLYARLQEYIDRSREMYDKRVKPEVAAKYDYFHQELVNTLAEGDVARLGEAYPGATVSA